MSYNGDEKLISFTSDIITVEFQGKCKYMLNFLREFPDFSRLKLYDLPHKRSGEQQHPHEDAWKYLNRKRNETSEKAS